MAEFVTPEILKGLSTDEIHEYMRSIIPADIDMSEGNHAWNMTRPTALAVARMGEFILPEVIRIFVPQFSYGSYLDDHARARGMKRLAATAATGQLTISGDVGAVIPAGSLFATASVNDEPSVGYRTIEHAEIPESGTVTVDIECTQTGIIGNTGAGTIVLVGSRLTGVKAVTNEEEISGGTEEETDESLSERITEYDQTQGESFIGNAADYKRWAMSVPGVGDATVIPAQDDTGLVTIIVTDANGAPATMELCADVYNYIMKPHEPAARLAPVNAYLMVSPPQTIAIAVSATVELDSGATLDAVRAKFAAQLALYLPTAMEQGEVKYSRVAAVLAAVEGAYDFTDLKIGVNDGSGTITLGTSNISIGNTQLPSISEDNLILNGGVVGDTVQAPSTDSGTSGGVGDVATYATLDENGKIVAEQLPDYVDDVIEGYYSNGVFYNDSSYTDEISGETGKIYVDIATGMMYRYDGSSYKSLGSNANLDTLTESEIDEIYDETI